MKGENINRNVYIYLTIGGLLCLLLNSLGLDTLVPNKKVRDIVFENEKNVYKNLSTLVHEREIIRSMVTTAWAEYSPEYKTTELIPFYYNEKITYIERNTLNGMRSYLLRTMAPDEGVLIPLERMNLKKLNFNPHYFTYGGFYIYSEGLYLAILKLMGVINLKRDIAFYILHPEEMGKIYIALRFVNSLLALGSFLLIFLIGTRIQGQWHGILSSLLFIFTPGIVIWNHFARPHIFSLFWILLALYFFIKTLQEEKAEIKNFILACIFTGIVAGILIPYGIVMLLMIPLTVALKKHFSSFSQFTKRSLFGLLIVLAIFLITNPYLLADIQEVLSEYRYTRMDVRYVPSLQNYLYYLTTVLKIHMGIFLWILCLLSVFISLYKPKKEEWLILFPFLMGFLLFGTSYPNYMLRFVFFLPFVVLIAGNGILKISKIKKLYSLAMAYFILCFCYTALYTGAYLNLLKGEDTRYMAGKWINTNIPAGTSIGLKEYPVAFRTPPFSFAKYKVQIVEDKNKFQEKMPEYFVVSSFDWRFSSYEEIKYYLSDYYEEFKVFRRVPEIFNITFNVQYRHLPPDYCYFNPEVVIWKRKRK